MNAPVISVLMTAYNREQYIGAAIESVLASTFTDFELIIVDDCSSDKTVQIGRQYAATDKRVKVYVNEKNLGDYPNRNKAASHAQAKYLKYVDSDDRIFPHTLGVMVKAMENHSEAALGLGARDHDTFGEEEILLTSNEAYHEHLFVNGFLENGPLAAIIRKDIFTSIGGFSGKRMIGDIELWLKIAAKYHVLRLPKGLVYWRRHEGQEYQQGGLLYLTAGLQMYAAIVRGKDCPLTASEQTAVIKAKKKNSLNILFRYMLKTGDIFNTIRHIKTVIAV